MRVSPLKFKQVHVERAEESLAAGLIPSSSSSTATSVALVLSLAATALRATSAADEVDDEVKDGDDDLVKRKIRYVSRLMDRDRGSHM